MLKGGYHGKILRVNLSNGDIQTQPLDNNIAQRFLGGRGYGAKLLYDENPAGVEPFEPENRLIFFTSPLMGTSAPLSVKCCAVTKSPLSQTIVMSMAGGNFGPELKLTGHDGIVIVGRAEHPVYIQINNEEVQIKDARFLWGKDTFETQDRLKVEVGDKLARIATIGLAGENKVRFASIISGRHAFGRGGVGAVMGAKNLKAIVARGTKTVNLFDQPGFDDLVRKIRKRYKESDMVKNFTKYGTTRVVSTVNERGIFPTRNYQFGTFEGAGKINGEARLAFVKNRVACYRCPVGCNAITTVDQGPYSGTKSEGPEFETLWSFGSQCGNDSLPAIIAAEALCDRHGLDTISTGNAIGFAMECFEKGLITKAETDGIDLKFGNDQAMVEMVRKIGERDGFGDVLAEGTSRASQRIGKNSYKLAMQVKGSELSGYDPRGAMGQGLSYATSPRGGDHQKALIAREVFGAPPPIDRFTVEGKAEVVKYVQNEMAVLDALGICNFTSRGEPQGMKEFAQLYTYTAGIETTPEDLLIAGERIFNLERMFNNREGFTRKDDILPERFLNEPFSEGPSAGHTVPLTQLLDDYYQVRSWDSNGIPSKKILIKLGLEG